MTKNTLSVKSKAEGGVSITISPDLIALTTNSQTTDGQNGSQKQLRLLLK